MKIAVSSSNGENVDLHFGKSSSLYIYDFDEEINSINFLEKRIVNLDDEKHQGSKVLEIIKDCDVIISEKIGFKSKILLDDANIKSIQDSGPINQVLDRYIKHYIFMKTPI